MKTQDFSLNAAVKYHKAAFILLEIIQNNLEKVLKYFEDSSINTWDITAYSNGNTFPRVKLPLQNILKTATQNDHPIEALDALIDTSLSVDAIADLASITAVKIEHDNKEHCIPFFE